MGWSGRYVHCDLERGASGGRGDMCMKGTVDSGTFVAVLIIVVAVLVVSMAHERRKRSEGVGGVDVSLELACRCREGSLYTGCPSPPFVDQHGRSSESVPVTARQGAVRKPKLPP